MKHYKHATSSAGCSKRYYNHATCSASCNMKHCKHATCSASCNMSMINMQRAMCNMQHATCRRQQAALQQASMQHARGRRHATGNQRCNKQPARCNDVHFPKATCLPRSPYVCCAPAGGASERNRCCLRAPSNCAKQGSKQHVPVSAHSMTRASLPTTFAT
jgi:hypothetical protein